MTLDVSFHEFAENIATIYNHLTPADIATIYQKLHHELTTIQLFPGTLPTIQALQNK